MEKTVLEKNLEQISRYNPNLAKKINDHTHIEGDCELVEAKSGDVILRYNNLLLHDDIDPQEEAMDLFKRLSSNDKQNINVIFGLGLGYLFKRFTMSAKGRIIVYEPNLDILRVTLEIVDFSEELSRDLVVLVDCFDDIEKNFERLYVYWTEITLSFLESYLNLYPDLIPQLAEDLGFLKGLYSSNYKNLIHKIRLWTSSGLNNLGEVMNNMELESLRGKFIDKPAIIVSAGPSLDKAIDTLKENKDKAVIFCVGTSIKTLLKHGITPDFLVIVEHNDCSEQIAGIDISNMNLILHPSTHNKFHKSNAKRKFNYYPNNDFLNKWLAEIIDIPLEDYHNKGTVSLCALFSTMIMGCNPIILVGQDLAYIDGRCYSKDSAYKDFKCIYNEQSEKFEINVDDLDAFAKKLNESNGQDIEKIKEAALNRFQEMTENLYKVKGQNGEMLPTESGYATFIRYLENTALEFGNKFKFINSSIGGAYIKGFKHMPLKSALDLYAKETIQTETIIETAVKSGRNLLLEKGEKVIKALDEDIEAIEAHKEYFEQGLYYAKRLKSDIDNKRFYSDSIKKYFEKILNNFNIINENLLIKHPAVHGIILGRSLLLTSTLYIYESLDIDSIKQVAEYCYLFFTSYCYILDGLQSIKESRQRIYESLNPTS